MWHVPAKQAALSQTREFDTNAASFQAELTRIGQTYEGQLSELCGVFTAPDGRVFPAIGQFAIYNDIFAEMGDPCGFAGNGQIHENLLQVDIARLELARTVQQMNNVRARIRLSTEHAAATCDQQIAIADYQYRASGRTFNLEEDMIRSQEVLEYSSRILETAASVAGILTCSPETCAQAALAANLTVAAAVVNTRLQVFQRDYAADLRERRSKIDRKTAKWTTLQGCESATIELNHQTSVQLLDLLDLEIALAAAENRVVLELSQVSKSRQQARRIQLEMDESFDIAINVEAARNDPNVRIYRNDSVINAEIAFEDALREAYRLTLVYQYYSSTSYAALDQLFLTRMVSAGDYNLENYVYELRNAFNAFEEEFGNPDTRVILVSLRDDILKIPRLGTDGQALSIDERAALMRAELNDPNLLNSDGYLTLPFATNLEELSAAHTEPQSALHGGQY